LSPITPKGNVNPKSPLSVKSSMALSQSSQKNY